MLLQRFLKTVLPSEGVYRWHSITDGKKHRQGSCTTIDELAEKLIFEDKRGADAYFACASFKDGSSRKAENALYCKAFWLDIDAGEGKPYGDAAAAELAVDSFCDSTGLPTPHIIRSGSGVHAWWPLKENLPAEEWRVCAEALGSLCSQHTLHVDSSRTSDLASILRPPGTHNRKRGGCTDVEWHESEDSGDVLPVLRRSSLSNVNMPRGSGANAALLGGLSTGSKPDFTVGAPAGERNNTCAKYAGWLLGPGKNSYDEALTQCLRWNRLNQPPLEDHEVETTVRSIYGKEQRKPKEETPFPEELISELPTLPERFKWEGMAMRIQMTDPDTDVVTWKDVTPYPVFLTDVCKSGSTSPGDSYIFRIKKPLEDWYEVSIPLMVFKSPAGVATLCSMGMQLKPYTEKYYREYVAEHEIIIRRQKVDPSRNTQFGWRNDRKEFLIGDVIIHEGGRTERAFVSDSLAPYAQAMCVRGTREEWTGCVNTFFQPGLEALAFSIIFSMTAPLMPFCFAEDDGGCILALFSENSGKGKSPALAAMCSVWGDIKATRFTGNTTEGAIIDALARQSNLPLVIDEFTRCDHTLIADRVKNFTTGTDRTRLRKDGTRGGMPDHFQTTLVVGCNHDLYGILRASDPGGTSMARVLQLTMPDINDTEFNNITRGLGANCGHAGRELIFRLQDPRVKESAMKTLQGNKTEAGTLVQHYRQKLGTTTEHRYIASGLAAAHFVGALVKQSGIIEFNYERMMDYGVAQAARRVAAKTKDTSIERFTAYLADNIESCLVVEGPYNPAKGPQVAIMLPRKGLHMRMETRLGMLYVSTAHLRFWCVKNKIAFESFEEDLFKGGKGILKDTRRMVLLAAGTGIPAVQCNCWAVDAHDHAMAGGVKVVVDNRVAGVR